jgi:hypothetical protein
MREQFAGAAVHRKSPRLAANFVEKMDISVPLGCGESQNFALRGA